MWVSISDKGKITASGHWKVGGVRLELFIKSRTWVGSGRIVRSVRVEARDTQ